MTCTGKQEEKSTSRKSNISIACQKLLYELLLYKESLNKKENEDFHIEQLKIVYQMEHFIRQHPKCFERQCLPGHMTSSALIISQDSKKVLLTHHAKLNLWLQLGGHCDGEGDVERVALREAQEESGIKNFVFYKPSEKHSFFDLDIHTIPATGSEPEHLHYDIRYLLLANENEELCITAESRDLQWVPFSKIRSYSREESLLRMIKKARKLIGL